MENLNTESIRYDLINKIREIPFIPTTNYITTKRVAKFFDVGEEKIKTLCIEFKDIFEEDGVKYMNKGDILNSMDMNDPDVNIVTGVGKYHIIYKDERIEMPYSKVKIFYKKSIIRIATLLENNDIALKIREVTGLQLTEKGQKEEALSNTYNDLNKTEVLKVDDDINEMDNKKIDNHNDNATYLAIKAIESFSNLKDLISAIEGCEENIVAFDKFSQDLLHDIEMGDLTDQELLEKARLIKCTRTKRRYNKNVKIISEFINRQVSNIGLNSSKIDMIISKLQNAKAKLEATENGVAYNRRFDELNESQKETIRAEILK